MGSTRKSSNNLLRDNNKKTNSESTYRGKKNKHSSSASARASEAPSTNIISKSSSQSICKSKQKYMHKNITDSKNFSINNREQLSQARSKWDSPGPTMDRSSTKKRYYNRFRSRSKEKRQNRLINGKDSYSSLEKKANFRNENRDNTNNQFDDLDIAKRKRRSDHEREAKNNGKYDRPTVDWGQNNESLDNNSSQHDKQKPNYELSGALSGDTNKANGIVIKYTEPPEARKPKRRWRLYPFKGENVLPTLHIHRKSCFLIGRDRKVVDLAVDHPSCSKQHAALQYRLVPFIRTDGSNGKRVRLYVIDLDSSNGTFLNNKKIFPRRYYELMEKDVLKFGYSTREYVLLHENSKEDQEDDDVNGKLVENAPSDI